MNKKVVYLSFIIFISTINLNCNRCDDLNSLADLIIDIFRTVDNPIVNVAGPTVLTIKNFIYQAACRDQESAGGFYSNYKVFYRENGDEPWTIVGSSSDFRTESLDPGEVDDIESEITFTQSGQYYLSAATDVGSDIVEYNEDNNGKKNENGEFDLRIVPSINIDIINYIQVKTTPDTDFELMRKRKEEGIYVIFN